MTERVPRKFRVPVAVAAMVLMTIAPAAATDDACAEPQTQTEMNACASASYKTADATLNSVWDAMHGCMRKQSLDAEFEAVLALQRAWLTYRNAYCTAQANRDWGAPPSRGTGWPVGYYGCMADATDTQTAFLRARHKDCQSSDP